MENQNEDLKLKKNYDPIVFNDNKISIVKLKQSY